MSYQKDYAMGIQSEKDILPQLNTYFKRNLTKTSERYCKYDFNDDKGYKYELKTRNNTYSTYPTTIIGCDKLEDKMIFLFKFTDGLYFIEYDQEQFKLFDKKLFIRNARTDYKDIKKDYIFIPIKYLNKII